MYLDDFFKKAPHILIEQLSCDSRDKMNNCIFFCVKGIKYNGHDYIEQAIQNGASVIVFQDDIDTNYNAIFIKVNNVDDTLINVSNKFYDYPSKKLETYLISGTNGRSSVSRILQDLIQEYKKCSSIGIFGKNYGDINLLSNQPTLTILDNQKALQSFIEDECQACTFEASALSLSFKKLDAIKPNVFIYTQTVMDSKEYTECGISYLDYEKRYLYSLDENTCVILNSDDKESYSELSKASSDNKLSYGQDSSANFRIDNIQLFKDHTCFDIEFQNNKYNIQTKLLGVGAVYNITAALVGLYAMHYDLNELIEKIKDIDPVDGVMDMLNFSDYNIYVDCASSLGNYEEALYFTKKVTDQAKKVIALVSINTTDSDERLHSLMNIADKYADMIILTEDDTYEDDIMEVMDIASKSISKAKYLLIEDREEAIEEAIEILNKGDSFIMIGKGNEKFLYKGLVKQNYSGDKNIAYKYMNKRLREENE